MGHPPPYFVFKSMTQPKAVLGTAWLPLRQVNWGSISNVSEEASKAMEYVQSKSKPVEVITAPLGWVNTGWIGRVGKIPVVRGIFPSHPTIILWLVYTSNTGNCTIFSSTQSFPSSPQKTQDIISTAQLPVSSVRDAVILLQQPGSGAGRTLDVEELREIVAELIAAYSEPDLQRSWPYRGLVVGGWIRVGGIYNMDVSLNGGIYPPNHPWINRVFHYFHHPFWDTIILGNHHMVRGRHWP